MEDVRWSGCWEIRPGRYICRWMIAWVKVHGVFNGCVGGYSGGGAFQLEKFSVHGEDIVTSDLPNFSEALTCAEISLLENCQDAVLSMHSEELWEENDTLVLLPQSVQELKQDGDLLFGGEALPNDLLPLFERVGLITRPVKEIEKWPKKTQ